VRAIYYRIDDVKEREWLDYNRARMGADKVVLKGREWCASAVLFKQDRLAKAGAIQIALDARRWAKARAMLPTVNNAPTLAGNGQRPAMQTR
jgi:hypothetical protein